MVFYSLRNPLEIIRFRPQSFRESSRPTRSGQVRPASADASVENPCIEAPAELPQERLSCCKLASETEARRPSRINEQQREDAGLRSPKRENWNGQRSFRKSFRKQSASAKPSASFRVEACFGNHHVSFHHQVFSHTQQDGTVGLVQTPSGFLWSAGASGCSRLAETTKQLGKLRALESCFVRTLKTSPCLRPRVLPVVEGSVAVEPSQDANSWR